MIALLLLFAAPAPLEETIYDRLLGSTAMIIVRDSTQADKVKTGTGSLIGESKSGKPVLVTNYHVIAEGKQIHVQFPQRGSSKELITDQEHYFRNLRNTKVTFEATVLASSESSDLAILELQLTNDQQLPESVKYIGLSPKPVKPSQTVHTLGNTGGSGMWSYTRGEVRTLSKRSVTEGQRKKIKVIETTNPTNPGDSGGPLVNDACQLVGITMGGITKSQLVSLFIDIDEMRVLALRHVKLMGNDDLVKAAMPLVKRAAAEFNPHTFRLPIRPTRPQVISDKEFEEHLKALNSKNVHWETMACEQLRYYLPNQRRSEIADLLVELLQAHEERTRENAALALGVWAETKHLPALRKKLDDKQQDVQSAAMLALSQLHDGESASRIVELWSQGGMTGITAHKAVAELGVVTEPYLLKMVNHSNITIRLQVYEFLGKFGTRKSLPVLRERLRQEKPNSGLIHGLRIAVERLERLPEK